MPNAEPMSLFDAAQLLSQRADRMRLMAGSVSPSLADDMLREERAMRLAITVLLTEDGNRRTKK
jgi:hypothetical protein